MLHRWWMSTRNSNPTYQAQRRITSRQLSINGLGTDMLEWKYSEGVGSGGNPVDNNRNRVISIIAPDKTRTEVYQYNARASDGTGKFYWNFDLASSLQGLVFQKKIYSTSADGLGGQLLRREITQYEQTTRSYPFSGTCGQTGFTRQVTVYRNPRPIKTVSIIFEGSGPALAQTITFSYDTSDEMKTGVDQTLATTSHYVVVDNATAQTGTLAQIQVGSLASIRKQLTLILLASRIVIFTGTLKTSSAWLR